ncbi:hypothetical protein TcWFU_001362 [Taenia crassiceps]|uniref:Uncharacterized protein n=1 Tax=Taenia crassiceps TaxID=6207 RepID=A0ABR4QFZ6_9CEST
MGATNQAPIQVVTNERLKAIEDELEDLKLVRQTGDRRLHEELVAKTQSLKNLEERFVKVSAELEMNVVDANAKNKALEEALRNKQEILQRVITECDAMRKAKCTLTLRLQVAEDRLRDVEHKLNSRVLGVEMEKARLTEALEGVRAVAETAEEISSRIQRTLCDIGVTVPQHLPSNNSPTLLIQRLIDYANQLLIEFQKILKERDALKSELSRREVDEAKSHRIKEFLHHEVDRYASECRRLSRELDIGKTRRSLEKAAGKLEAKVRSASSISVRRKSVDDMLMDKFNEEISGATHR